MNSRILSFFLPALLKHLVEFAMNYVKCMGMRGEGKTNKTLIFKK